MAGYGRPEIAYYQITPYGEHRLRAGQLRQLDTTSRHVLGELVRLGGTAEWDELKFLGTKGSPMVLGVALRRLIDLGYVAPVSLEGAIS